MNKAQTKALARLEQVSDRAFQDVTQKGSIPLKDQNNHLLAKLELKEFSAREIQTFAEDIEKTNIKNQKRIDTAQRKFSTQIKIAVMTRLGIPLVRIAQRLNIHRETISKYAQKNQGLFNNIHQDFKSSILFVVFHVLYFISLWTHQTGFLKYQWLLSRSTRF